MKTWRCSVCGYIHKGDSPPEKCPNCGADRDKFGEVEIDFEKLHMNLAEKISYGDDIEVNPFFGDYEALSPFVYNLPIGLTGPLHKHPTTDEVFFVIKGKIHFWIGDKEFVGVKGDVLQGRMNVPHKFKNIGDEPAVFLSVKGPKPVDLEIIEE